MPLGGGEFKDKLLDNLNKNKHIFQKYIAFAKLKSKFTPKINFYIDNTFDEAEKIEKLLLNKKVINLFPSICQKCKTLLSSDMNLLPITISAP